MDDLFDEFAGFPSVDVSPGTPVDFNWNAVDFGAGDSYSGPVDLGSLENFGFDLGNEGFNWDDFYNNIESGLNLGGASFDEMAQWYSPQIEGFADAADEVGGAAQQDTSESQYSTTRQNADGTITQTFDDGSTITIAKDPVTGREEVVDYTTATDVPPAGGEIVPSGTGRGTTAPTGGTTTGGTTTGGTTGGTTTGGKTTTTDNTKDIKSIIDKFTGSSGNTALLAALLGGLMGLLGRKEAPKLPVGYQGGIPEYTARRVPGRGVEYTKVAAQGGLMGLAAGGAPRPARYLRGGTDGMADKIETNIDGEQPALLSHGEFVIPADVVSHLGNGNSDAGADVLYEMMAKVRKARTGTPRQGRQINPRKILPV